MHKFEGKIRKPANSICENCQSEFLCQRLKTAMTIMESKLDRDPVALKELNDYYKTVIELQEKGWEYPQNIKRCQFENSDEEVATFTNSLIEALK